MRTITRTLFCCWFLAAAAPLALADRGAIEKILEQMQTATLAADVDGYLAHVSQADPIFHKEQFNWAKDLKRIKPSAVEFTIGKPPEGQTEEFGDAKARFELVINWTLVPEKPDGKPQERTVSYPAVFTKTASGEWLFDGEDWLVMEGGGGGTIDPEQTAEVRHHDEAAAKPDEKKSDDKNPDDKKLAAEGPRPRDVRFQGPEPAAGASVVIPGTPPANGSPMIERRCRVKYFPGYEAVAKRLVEVLPDVRDHVDEGFQGRIHRVQEVKIYPTMRHLQESIYLSYTDGLSGWNEPHESIKMLVRPTTSKRSLTSLLAHEYGHVATFEFGEKANDMPWWVLEGVAELSCERFVGFGSGRDAEAAVVSFSKSDKLADWKDLADFHTVPGSLQRNVYKQGQHMLGYISDRFGRDGRNAWMRSMSEGGSIDEATKAALGMSFADLDTQWREAVKMLVEKAAADKARKDEEAAKKTAEKKDDAKPEGKGDGKSETPKGE